MTHQLLPWKKQTELGEKRKSLIYHQSNQSSIVRKKSKKKKKAPSLHSSLFLGLILTPIPLPPPPEWCRGNGEWGLRSVHHVLSLPILLPQGEDSSHSSPTPIRGPSHRRRWSRLLPGPVDRITQSHRMFRVGRDLCGSSSPTPLTKQGHL